MEKDEQLPSIIEPQEKEILKQFAENKAKELEIQLLEAQTAKENSKRNFDFANKQLEAQERDYIDYRKHNLQYFKNWNRTILCIILIVFAFFGFCVYMGKDQVVLELVKIICYGTPFGIGGFCLGRSKSKTEEKKQSTQDT